MLIGHFKVLLLEIKSYLFILEFSGFSLYIEKIEQNSYFSVEELANYSECIPSKISGNIVNEETIWKTTGIFLQDLKIGS